MDPARSKADICRDVLGLIHRQPDLRRELHLAAFHIPAAVLTGKGHFRPIFMEANDHRRFSTKSRATGGELPPPVDYDHSTRYCVFPYDKARFGLMKHLAQNPRRPPP